MGFYAFFRRLSRLHARVDESVVGDGAGALASAPITVDDALLYRAQIGEPLRIDLTMPVGDVTFVLARVLSGWALTHIDARDSILACLARHATALKRSQRPADLDIRRELMDELAYQRALNQWIATSDSAPRLPFDPLKDPRPDVPPFFHAIHQYDAVRILAAFHRVNGAALAVLRKEASAEELEESKGHSRAGSWLSVTATLEADTQHAVPAEEFWRNRGLVSLLANRIIAAREQSRQMANAKEKAERDAKRQRR